MARRDGGRRCGLFSSTIAIPAESSHLSLPAPVEPILDREGIEKELGSVLASLSAEVG